MNIREVVDADGNVVQVTNYYSVPPVDDLDFAAYKHDKAYDRNQAEGIKGALFNTYVYNADAELAGAALGIYANSYNKNTRKAQWAKKTGMLFTTIAILKNLINRVK